MEQKTTLAHSIIKGCILHGDFEKESHRIASYSKSPCWELVVTIELSQNGFYYTGRDDRVKCFSCGREVANWKTGENVRNEMWHHDDCKFILDTEKNIPESGSFTKILHEYGKQFSSISSISFGHDCGDQPEPGYHNSASNKDTGPYYRQNSDGGGNSNWKLVEIVDRDHKTFLGTLNLLDEKDRMKTFENWPSSTISSVVMARNGFFYLGNHDRVQCHACNGVLRNWSPTDDVCGVHHRQFPNCRFSKPNQSMPVSPTIDVLSSSLNTSGTSHSIGAHDKHYEAAFFPFRRFRFFSAIGASKRQKKISGCWYCNDGFTNWMPLDEPWTEGGTFCAGCNLDLRRKWKDFIDAIYNGFPGISVKRLATYDLYSIAFAMKIRIWNLKIVAQTASASYVDWFHRVTSVVPKISQSTIHPESNRRRRSAAPGDVTLDHHSDARPKKVIRLELGEDEESILLPTPRAPPYNRPQQQQIALFPHMGTQPARLSTFLQGWSNYPGIGIAPLQVANAGFFLEDGTTRCWFCGLQVDNWDADVDPWTVHTRMSPGCGFLLQMRQTLRNQRLDIQRRRTSSDSGMVKKSPPDANNVEGGKPRAGQVEVKKKKRRKSG